MIGKKSTSKEDYNKIDVLDLNIDEERLSNMDTKDLVIFIDKIEGFIDIKYLANSKATLRKVVENILNINKVIAQRFEELNGNKMFIDSYSQLRKSILRISMDQNLGESEKRITEILIKNHMTRYLLMLNPKLGPQNKN
ncbi:MAG: hypothetical protein V3575_06160 [Candidatus Absconditabacteria bacterium]